MGEKCFVAATEYLFKTLGILATMGQILVPCLNLKIGLFSTGDEIMEAKTYPLAPGCIRDVNSWVLWSFLKDQGYDVTSLGIIRDTKEALQNALYEALHAFDVILISGGSSVSVRDYCSEVLKRWQHQD